MLASGLPLEESNLRHEKTQLKYQIITLIEVVSTESINKCKCSLLLNEKETLDVKPVPSLSEVERRNEKQK